MMRRDPLEQQVLQRRGGKVSGAREKWREWELKMDAGDIEG